MSKWNGGNNRSWEIEGERWVQEVFTPSFPSPPGLLQLSVKGWEKPDSADNHRLIRGCIGSRLTLRRSLCALADTRRASLKHECTHRAGVIMVHNDTFEKKKKEACHYRWTSVCKDIDIRWSENTPQVARDPDYFPFFSDFGLEKMLVDWNRHQLFHNMAIFTLR